MRSEKISYLLSCIHSSDFPGVFATADVEELRQAVTSFSGVSYYDLLNVPNDAHAVNAATEKYRLMILRFHPDKTLVKPDQAARTEIFKLIQNAYETLSDPEKKQRYDACIQNSPTRTAGSNPSKQSDENEFYAAITYLKNNKDLRASILNNPDIILGHARAGRWGFVRCILIMFRDMLDLDYLDCMRKFPWPGSNDNPFYEPGRERTPAAALTEFANQFREPIISLLKESALNPAAGIFFTAFSVLKANSQWPTVEILLQPDHHTILNLAIKNLEDDWFRRDFQAIFKKAGHIEQLLRTVDQAQRKIICEECVTHIRTVFLFNEHDHFCQMDLSLFPQFIIDNFSVVLAAKATEEYVTEKQTSACCSSFFFSWKSAGSKTIFYALKEISDRCYFLYYGDTAHKLYHSGYALFTGKPIHDESHRLSVMASSKRAHELLFKTLLDHGSEVGTHLYAILRKYQLIDEDKKPSRQLFTEILLPENADRMRL